ncbi:glycosyltransferase family A protein [Pseudomonas sp. 273]|uniref:glycosyltransferase family 2 protein n=1 Tax=Pseudomonas sp. 273 TaxID=75692 RepID=UPI0023D89BD2|nr:glycosyltransferase family A protein [Pseudomonas sp. 273]
MSGSLFLRRLCLLGDCLVFLLRPGLVRLAGEPGRRALYALLGRRRSREGLVRQICPARPWSSQRPLLSVVIPCFNYGVYLLRALRSLREQTLQDVEVIVVDDGSDERHTLRLLARLQRWTGLKLLQQDNAGPGAARNAGVAQARGRYVCCLDADDWLAPDYLEKCVVLLEGEAGTRLAHSWMQVCGDEERLVKTRDLDPDLLRYVNHLGISAVFHREDWLTVDGFTRERGLHEDWDYWLRLADAGVRGRVIGEPLFFYRRHAGSRLSLINRRPLRAYRALRRAHLDFFETPARRRRLIESYRQQVVADPFCNLARPEQYREFPAVILVHLRDLDDAERCRLGSRLETFSLQLIVEHEAPVPLWLQRRAEIIYRLPALLEPCQWPAFVANFHATRKVVAVFPEVRP